MASKTTIELIDDVDGSEAAETIGFGVDGVEYEIDLSDEHAEELRAALREYVACARRLGMAGASVRDIRAHRPASRRRATEQDGDALSRVDRDHLRQWAGNNGYQVGDRGRIAMEVQTAWIAAGRPEE